MIAEKDFFIHITTRECYKDIDDDKHFSNAQKEIKKIFYNYNVLPNSGDVILSDNDYWFSVVHRNFSDDGHLGLLVTLDKNTNL
jgi:hypothetical protein